MIRSQFLEGVAGNSFPGDLSLGSCTFYIKHKLKSVIFNDKKSLWTKMFFSVITKNLNWEILLKNLVTFKKWNGVGDENY